MSKKILAGIAATTLIIAVSAQAHDQGEHTPGAPTPNCEKMKTMDHSKMDMDDAVMQAMMKQCAAVEQHHHTTANKEEMAMHHDHQKMMEMHSSASSEEHGKHND
ncbi:hypothetical protein P886_1789 [Alteromonadaceae bacterium 2753L.S.0a.02]|nr:hypothetical protein P886_1789 [Alteromonadaceae bacterium 2753L.S.0a.02]